MFTIKAPGGCFLCHHIHFYLFLNAVDEDQALKDFNYLISDLKDTLKPLSTTNNFGNGGIQLNKRWKSDAYFHHVSNEFDDMNQRVLYLSKLDQEPRFTKRVLVFARDTTKPVRVVDKFEEPGLVELFDFEEPGLVELFDIAEASYTEPKKPASPTTPSLQQMLIESLEEQLKQDLVDLER